MARCDKTDWSLKSFSAWSLKKCPRQRVAERKWEACCQDDMGEIHSKRISPSSSSLPFDEAVLAAKQAKVERERTRAKKRGQEQSSLRLADALESVGYQHARHGQHVRALAAAREALEIRQAVDGPSDRRTIVLRNQVGCNLSCLDRYEDAVAVLEEGVRLLQTDVPESMLKTRDSTLLFSLQGNLASCYADMGNPKRALEMMEDGEEFVRKTFPENSVPIAQYLHILASIMSDLGHYPTACLMQEEAFSIRSRQTPEHRFTGTMAHNLGFYYEKMSRFEEALPLYRFSLERKACGNGSHPDVAITNLAVARVQSRLGQHKAALEGTKATLDYLQGLLPNTRGTIGCGMHQLAEVLYAQGDLEAARLQAEDALRFRRASLEPGLLAIHRSERLLAKLYFETGDTQGASELARTAYEAFCSRLPPTHPDLLQAKALLDKVRGAPDLCCPVTAVAGGQVASSDQEPPVSLLS